VRHATVAVSTLAWLGLLRRKIDWFGLFFIATQAFCAALLVFPQDPMALKRLYDLTYLSTFPFQFYMLITLLLSLRDLTADGPRFGALLYGVCAFLFCAMYDVITPFFMLGGVLISHYGFFVLLLSCMTFVASDIVAQYRSLLSERRLSAQYRQAAMHDPLTNAFNRSVFPLLKEELRVECGLMIIDVDDFKSVNDQYGHQTGDRVLRNLAAIIKSLIRSNDYLIRYGGTNSW
jgi:predicted signal transduction protein with EAL and GGDEF domain